MYATGTLKTVSMLNIRLCMINVYEVMCLQDFIFMHFYTFVFFSLFLKKNLNFGYKMSFQERGSNTGLPEDHIPRANEATNSL